MEERRKTSRARTFLGARLAYNKQFATLDCLVRNLSEDGAKLHVSDGVTVPDEVDLTIAQRQTPIRAHVIWRKGEEAGVAFVPARSDPEVIPLELVRRLRDCEAEKRALQRRAMPADAG